MKRTSRIKAECQPDTEAQDFDLIQLFGHLREFVGFGNFPTLVLMAH